MDLLVSHWAEDFGRIHPAWTLEVDGRGSRVALQVLARSGADLAAFSRMPDDLELAGAGWSKAQFPRRLVVGFDTLRLFWRQGRHPDPKALQSAYLGASGQLRPFGRNLSSGTRSEAQSALGGDRDFGPGIRSLSSPAQVALAVTSDPLAVGYGGSGHNLSRLEFDGSFLRVRPLVLAIPAGPVKTELAEFLSYILSRQGQALVRQVGFCPMETDSVLAMRSRLRLNG